MTPPLYHLHMSRHVQGMARGPVRAATLCDFPHRDSVRACLPSQYRQAFDRAITRDAWARYADSGTRSLTLRDTRGHCFNTIYAIPQPAKESAS